MKENSIERDEEILNNIKAYMQENIDKGFHKFIYNDLGYDEKCVDVINAIEHILLDYKRVLQENEKLKTKLLDTLEGQKVIKEETPQYIKENYIPKDKIEEILNETEITDFNSLVEAFLEIKKLLESE